MFHLAKTIFLVICVTEVFACYATLFDTTTNLLRSLPLGLNQDSQAKTGWDDGGGNDDEILRIKRNDERPSLSSASTPKIFVGETNFESFRLKNDIFVDKSLLLKEIAKPSAASINFILRPAGWGKSLNLNMIQKFFQIEMNALGKVRPEAERENCKLFAGGTFVYENGEKKELRPLKISEDRNFMARFQGKIPVLLLDLGTVVGNSYEQFEKSLSMRVRTLYLRFSYLQRAVDSNADLLKEYFRLQQNVEFKKLISASGVKHEDLISSLTKLSELLYNEHREEVLILVDNYDSAIINAYTRFGNNSHEFQKAQWLILNLLASLQKNVYLRKAIVTGTLRIPTGELNTADVRGSLLDENFAQFFGFTRPEVEQLLSSYAETTSKVGEISDISDWYGGYGIRETSLYTPRSVMSCLQHGGQVTSYWPEFASSACERLVDKALELATSETLFQYELVAEGRRTKIRILPAIYLEKFCVPFVPFDDLFSLLFYTGYLNVEPIDHEAKIFFHKLYLGKAANKEALRIMNDLIVRKNISCRYR